MSLSLRRVSLTSLLSSSPSSSSRFFFPGLTQGTLPFPVMDKESQNEEETEMLLAEKRSAVTCLPGRRTGRL